MDRTTAQGARGARCAVAAAAVVLAAAAGCTTTGSHVATPVRVAQTSPAPASSSDRWRIVYRTAEKQTELTGIAPISASDAWVVGYHGFPRARPLVLHWNGTAWRSVRLPASRSFVPDQVVASAPGNVWIDGVNRATGDGELYRFDGASWRTVPLPPGRWSSNLVAATGPAEAWLAAGGCKRRSWPWNCSSTVEQWTGTRWIASRLRVLESGLAAVGGHVWVVGLTGTRPADGGDGTGRVVLLQQTRTGWHPIAAPDATVAAASPAVVATGSELPQLTAGPGGTAWVLVPGPGGSSGQGTLFRLDSTRWAPVAIPAKAGGRRLYVQDQLIADGRTGVWAGPSAHWTGHRWVSVTTVRPGQPGTVHLSLAAGIPGASGSWAIGNSGAFIVDVPSGPGVIAVNGPQRG